MRVAKMFMRPDANLKSVSLPHPGARGCRHDGKAGQCGSWKEMMMRVVRVALLTFASALWSWPSHGQSESSQVEWINAMRQGGYVIVLRHGATPTDQAD